MFSSLTHEAPSAVGKRIYGLPSRREQEFSIGWEPNSQLNDFQLRKTKNREVTGKITTNSIIQGQPTPQSQPQRQPQPDYERIFYENPNITEEELEKLMMQYDQYRSAPSRNSVNAPSEVGQGERRAQVRPKESMKDIIFNGVGVGEERSQRRGSNYKEPVYYGRH